MKKFILLIIFICTGVLTQAQGYRVKKYTVDIQLSKKGYFDVVEQYDVKFQTKKHGIFREIVTKFDYEQPNGEIEKRRMYISKLKTPGEKHKVNPRLSLQNLSDNLQIRIGDESRYVSGNKNYEIRYRVKNALFQHDSIVQLYWNVKPSNWDAPFEEVSFTVHTPEGTEINPENTFVYAGIGNTEVSQEFTYSYGDRSFTAKSKAGFQSNPRESVTVLIKMPEEAFTRVSYAPGLFKQYGWILFILLPILYLWRQRNKYCKKEKITAVTSYYAPKGIDSAMAGYLINSKADANDLISLIPKWGAEGLIKIRETSKKGWFGKGDMVLYKIKELPAEAPGYEQTIFQGLFSQTWKTTTKDIFNMIKNAAKSESKEEFIDRQNQDDTKTKTTQSMVLISDLKDHFYKTIKRGKEQLQENGEVYYDKAVAQKRKRLGLIGTLWWIIGSVLLWALFGIIALFANIFIFPIALGLIIGKMKKRTAEGDKTYGKLKGFKNFIKIAETNRIKMLIQEDPDYFEKTMSYALTFGLLKQWAKKFEALNIEPPEWYTSEKSMTAMGMSSFANSFSNQMSATKSTLVSSPKSSRSGGGSAGGGAGSGGGGSW